MMRSPCPGLGSVEHWQKSTLRAIIVLRIRSLFCATNLNGLLPRMAGLGVPGVLQLQSAMASGVQPHARRNSSDGACILTGRRVNGSRNRTATARSANG